MSPTPEEAATRIGQAIADFEADAADNTEERSDLWDQVAEVPIEDLRTLLAERASLAAERDRLAGATKGLLKWLELICESQDIDPDETFVRASAVKDRQEKHELARVSLTQGMDKARAALAQPERREEG